MYRSIRPFARFFLIIIVLTNLFNPVLTPVVQAQTPTPTDTLEVQKSFTPSTIAREGISRLRITLNNANTFILTDVDWTDELPAGLSIADPPNTTSTCGGTLTANAGENTITLEGGAVAANNGAVDGTCNVALNVVFSGTDPGNYTNDINAGDVTASGDGELWSNLNPASAVLNVASFDFNAEINKRFDPISISPGDTSRLIVSIYNPNTFSLENASWTDNLIGIQPGIRIANPPNISTTDCGASPTVSAVAGETTLSLSGASVPAKVGSENGICTVAIDVTSTTPGNLINTVDGGNLSANGGGGTVSNTDPASATLNVDEIVAPAVTKAFASNTIWVGQSSRLTINIKNNDLTHTLSELSLTDTLNDPAPYNVVLASTVTPVLTNCGSSASLTANPGETSLTLSGAEIAPNTTCAVQVYVTSITQGEYTNTIPANTISTKQGVTNASLAEASLNVQAVSIAKAFSPASIQAGDTSTLTITLRNPTSAAHTGVSIADVMPGSVLELVEGSAATTCTTAGSPATVSVTSTGRSNDTVQLTNGTIPAGTVATPGICTITVGVTTPDSAPTAAHVNSIPAGTLTSDQPGFTNVLPSNDATLNISALSIGIVKTFSPNSIQQGGTTRLTITLQNRTSAALHVTSLTDDHFGGLIPIVGTESTTCVNGVVAAVESPASLTLTGADATGAVIPSGSVATPGTCSFSIDVTAAAAGSYTNQILANSIVTVEGPTNLDPASKAITVYATGKGMSGTKTFTPSIIVAGNNTRLRIQLTAPADQDLTNLGFTDDLSAANMVITNSTAATNSCGGTLTANTGENVITLSGGSLAKGVTCTIDVYVTSHVTGTQTNTIHASDITNTQGQTTANDFSRQLTVTSLTISKAFYPNTIAVNGQSTLTITLSNTSPSPLTSVSLTDNLTTMGGTNITIAPTPNAVSTCGGTPNAAAGSQTIGLTGGTIPAQVGGVPGICTLKVDVKASGSISPLPAALENTLPRLNVSATLAGVGTIRPEADAKATLNITALTLSVVKGFNPLTVFGGSSSVMSVQLINPNNAVLSGVGFTDNMPAGMYVANPPNASTGTCGGTLTANPNSNSFTFSGGTLGANKRCTITLNVTMNVNGNRTNTIPAGGVTTFNGVSNTQAAQASLTNLPGVSISKFFTPNEVVAGETSLLTIRIKNTGNIALSNMNFTDNLPGGLLIDDSPAATNACGGTLQATAGTGQIRLIDGSIIAGPDTTCDIVVPIVGSAPGFFTNIINKNNLTTGEGATNTEPAKDTLTINATPDMQLSKSLNIALSSPPPYTLGDTLAYTLVATNTGDVELTNVTITDSGGSVSDCAPALDSTLAPGASMTCTATHTVTADDVTASSYTNTATGDSNETDEVTDTVTAPIDQTYALNINKVITTTGPYELGNTLNYSITVTNIGSGALTNVSVTDPGTGVTLGTCTPAQPAALASGASMVCPASHVVVQADVNAGSYSNTATADSTETDPPVSDTVTVPIKQNARLQIFKQITSNGPYNTVGKRVTYDISAVNSGDQTLTGVTITDPGVGVTLGTCTPAQPATLTTGQILSCSAYHDITADDLTAGGYSNTAYADSDQTDPVSATAEVVSKTPTINLEKVGTLNPGANARADACDTISYAFTVTNSGEVTLTNIYLIDIVGGVTLSGGPIASLAPGESNNYTFTGSYTLKQADVDAGTFANIASAVGAPPVGSSVSDTDDDTQTFTAVPSIELSKIGTLDLSVVNPAGVANAGDKIHYTFSVSNNGNVTLTNVTVSDTVGGITISGSHIASLAPGTTDSSTYTGSYTLTQADVDAGAFTNTATVTATPPTGDNVTDTDDDTQDLPPVASINLVKAGTLDLGANSQADAGDQITYAFTVENTGNVTLSNITLDDIIPGVSITGGPITLAPGESDEDTFTGAYTLTQDDVDNGSFANTATVTCKTPKGADVTDTDDDSQSMEPAPSIELLKTGSIDIGSNGRVDAGEIINYVFTITNTGNVTLTNITLDDTVGGITITGGPIATLAPGASNNHTFSGSYTLTQDDVDAGTYTNTATVSASTPAGGTVTDEDDDTQDLDADRSIQLEKTGTLNMDVVPPNDHADPGDTITYEFTITNLGNVTLTDVTVTDSTTGVTLEGSSIASLAPGEEDDSTYTATYTITQDDVDRGRFTNESEVTAKAPTGETVTDLDDDEQNLGDAPRIGLRKRLPVTPTQDSENPGNWLVTFELVVKNLGNVTLTGIQVTDDLAAAFPAEDATFTVESLTSDDFTINPAFDGVLDLNLLDGTDSLAFEEQGTITLVVRVVPITGGPFNNSAEVTGTPPSGEPVTAVSHDDFDPDDPDDGTPFDFGPYLFDPPSVIKVVNDSRAPRLRWKLVLINNSNVVNTTASMSDPISKGTTYISTGAPSGYDVPLDAPEGSTNLGVSCTDTSDITETSLCYYEGPTTEFPRGRIIWEGVVGPDPGAKKAADAEHELTIIFDVRAKNGVHQVRNRAVISADLDGDGLIGADPEEGAVIVSRTWSDWPESLPETGFAPAEITVLDTQNAVTYDSIGDLRLEIPDLNVNSTIVGVPIDDGLWNLDWLGSQVGYLEETAFPTWDGNSALTAHNYDTNGLPGPFEKLENLTWGKQVIIHGWGKKYIYEVRYVNQWTAPDDVGVITHEETPWLTLITCRGYNDKTKSYNWRVVVRAVLVDVQDE